MTTVTMDDLKPGTRVHHVRWDVTGIVKVTEDIVHIKFDGSWVDNEISDLGPVFPSDLEILEDPP